MRIHILRHGPATPREEVGVGQDRDRALTPEGLRKTRQAARGMRALGIAVETVLTSPLVRARQTADIAALELGLPPSAVVETPVLEPGAPPTEVVRELARLATAGAGSVLLVGHEPGLSRLAAFLLTGDPSGLRLTLKKAALCLVECDPAELQDGGALGFLLQPAQLRAAAD